MPSREWFRIDREHRTVIEPFLEEAPIRIASMARELGLGVKSSTLKPKISGKLTRSEAYPSGFKITVNRHEVKTRQRFTIAHEIAHFLLHRDLIEDEIEDTILYRSNLSDAVEAEANRLASDLIMPENLVLERLTALGGRRTLANAERLADIFNVSPPAMRIRIGIQ